jgi:hypothetical protein
MIDDIIGHNKPLQHLPIGSIKPFGTNMYDEAIWRVVWSDSRYALSGGKHHVYEGRPSKDNVVNALGKDPNQVREEIGYKWVPLYPGIHAWVLEQWRSPFGFTGMSPEAWAWQTKDPETGLLELGPYPSRGDYAHSYTFPAVPGWSAVAMMIQMIEAGRNYSFAENKQAILKEQAIKQKDWSNNYDARAIDARPVGGIRPINLRPGKKSAHQKINFKHAAEEVGIRPQHRGVSVGEPILRS